MGLEIINGHGTGDKVKVGELGRMQVLATTMPRDYFINKNSGKVWSINFVDLNPAGDDDYVVYIKNTGDADLRVTDIRVAASAATRLQINAVTGTPSGGSAVTPLSRNLGSSATPSATIESGTDITGITSGGTLFPMFLDTANKEEHLSTSSNIFIPKGKAIGLLVETGTANITGVISLVESENNQD